MSPRSPGRRTALILAMGLFLLNLLLVVWSLFDAFFLLRAEAQQAADQMAQRLAAHLERGDEFALAPSLTDLAPPHAFQVALIGRTTVRVSLPAPSPNAPRAPHWYTALAVGEQLDMAAPLPGRSEQLVLTFDPRRLAAPYWQALRVPWWVANLSVLMFIVMANLWVSQKIRRLQQAHTDMPPSPLLQELLREERPGASTAAQASHAAKDEALQERLATHSGAALLVIDREGLVTYANAAAERLFGYEHYELVGKPAARLTPPWRHDELQASTAPKEMETQRLTRRGQLVDVLWHAVPLPAPAGEEPGAWLWSLWDISQRKREETVLRLLGRTAAFLQEGVVITEVAQDHAVIYANDAVARITGYAPQELLGRNLRMLYGDDRAQRGLDELKRALSEGTPCHVLLDNRRKDGSRFWNELSVVPIRDAAGRVTHFAGLMRDVTERHERVRELAHDEARLRTVIEDAPLAICITDAQHIMRAVNPMFARLFASEAERLVGHSLRELIPAEAWTPLKPAESGATSGGEITLTRKNGEVLTILANTASLGDGGEQAHSVTFLVDITGRKRMERALAEAKERAQVTLESIGEGVITTNANGFVDYLNPVAERLTGWVKEDVQGMPVGDVFKLLDEESREPLKDPVERALRLGRVITVNRRALLVTGQQEFSLSITATPIRDREQRILGAVVVFHDVTETRAAERQISYQARNDALTGLYNRREFQHRLEQALSAARDENQVHALGYLDLDRFKIINDTCGHAAGDEVLKQVAALLQSKLRAMDILARLGGDEFAMLLYSCSLDVAERIAEQIREAIHDYRFVWQDRVFDLGVSIGLIPVSADSGTVEEVLSAADGACYLAKNEGRDRVHVSQPHCAETEPASANRWLQRVRDGVDQDRFVLFDQTARRLNERGGLPAYHSIGLRLRDEKGELLEPASFMPTAARYHLLGAIDEWTVSTLLAHLARAPTKDVVYGVRLSSQTLAGGTFAEFVAQQLQRSGAAADAVCFELEDTDVLGNLTTAATLMSALKRLGCHLALADFGYGRASFAHLHTLPVGFLKFEGSMVKNLEQSPVNFVIAEAVSRVGQMLNMHLIATGVSDARTLEKLAELRVDYAEGPYIDPGHALTE